MNRTTLSALGFVCLISTAWSQTADNYIGQGRAYLSVTNLAAANLAFSNAVALDANHSTANVFYAATRLLMLPSEPAGSNFLTRLGVPAGGRNIYHWTARFPTDTNGVPLAPAGVGASEAITYLRTNVLAALSAAEQNLARVTETNFMLQLSAKETRMDEVTVDYGDIRLIRAMLKAAEYFVYTVYSWNLEAQLTALRSLYLDEELSIQRLFIQYPNLLAFNTTNDLASAREAFEQAAEHYIRASEFIRNRPTNVVRLFNYDPSKANDERTFRVTVTDLRNSLTGAVPLTINTNYSFFWGAHFSGARTVRSLLPAFHENAFVLGTFPDPTFGGISAGLTTDEIESFVSEYLESVPRFRPSFTRTGERIEFPLNVLTGRGYVVQASTDLVNWQDYQAFAAFSNTYLFSDVQEPATRRRFFRLIDRTYNMPRPSNDNFADRIPIVEIGVPVSGYGANSTVEPGESAWRGTVWWTWTATRSGRFRVSADGEYAYVQIFIGSSLSGLQRVVFGSQPFEAIAGASYQIQVAAGWLPPMPIQLTVEPAP